MKLVWTTEAKRDLREILSYIWFDNPAAAKRMRNRIETTAAYLKITAISWAARRNRRDAGGHSASELQDRLSSD